MKTNKIDYYSTDKVYNANRKKLSKKGFITISILITAIIIVSIIVSMTDSVELNKEQGVKYNENGNIDYKIYLKDNNYYDTSYLNKGMQYVASLIKTINVKYDYKMNSTENLNYKYRYRIEGNLQITERDQPEKILYNKKENIITEQEKEIKSDNYNINEEIDIDYNKYNSIVNSYKKDLGLTVSSNLILTLYIQTEATGEGITKELNKENKMQITIPLSEQTVNITLNTNEIKEQGNIEKENKIIKVKNEKMFTVTLLLITTLIVEMIYVIKTYIENYSKDIYTVTVNKILKNYDRLIVNGTASIKESKYPNKIETDKFEEMVDAAQNLNVPILYYELIQGEKCVFVVAKEDTLYKYRLTKAYLENNK